MPRPHRLRERRGLRTLRRYRRRTGRGPGPLAPSPRGPGLPGSGDRRVFVVLRRARRRQAAARGQPAPGRRARRQPAPAPRPAGSLRGDHRGRGQRGLRGRVSGGRQYRLLKELGTGTFGTVYQAEMQSVGGFRKQVALKVLHPMWERHEDAGQRFRDEARLLGQLRHRHIVQVDGLVRVSGRWAVIMEFIDGWDGNLVIKACRKAREPFPVPACLEICAAVAAALDAAWNASPDGDSLRVVHRDIKPSNIRLTPDGDIKVLDFGIARADFEGREALTQSVRYGSIRYMAPERRREEPDGAAGDIYSLGAVLYEFLVGRPLGNAELEWNQHNEKISKAMTRIERRCGPYAPPIVQLLEAMLNFAEAKRPPAAAVAELARKMAREIPGDDMASFARRFFPRVGEYVADGSRQMDRLVGADDDPSALTSDRSIELPNMFTEGANQSETPSYYRPVWGSAVACMLALIVQLANAPLPLDLPTARGVDAVVGEAYVARVVERPQPVAPVPVPVQPAPVQPEPVQVAAVQPAPAPTPVRPAPAPVQPAPAPVRPGPAPVQPAPAPTPVPVDAAPLRAAKFSSLGADRIAVTCVRASAEGTESALVRSLYPGPCKVTVETGGQTYKTTVEVNEARGLACTVQGGGLSCR
ncbi:MAG: serine/threonine protein kinase [Deltaproteobacteria bacterium]|nr:MAG: serine/threonine protein kinase [Deltaproteobacteria bacterium]